MTHAAAATGRDMGIVARAAGGPEVLEWTPLDNAESWPR